MQEGEGNTLDAVISYEYDAAWVWEIDTDRVDEVMTDGNFGSPAKCRVDEFDEYKQLPEHPLDNHFELVRAVQADWARGQIQTQLLLVP